MHQGCLVTECHILGAVHLTSSIVVLTPPLYWWHGLLKVYKLALSEVETSASKSLFLKLVFFCGVKILNKLWHKSWAAHAAWVSTQPGCPPVVARKVLWMWSVSFDTLTVSICVIFSGELQDTVLGKLGCFLHSHWEASFYHWLTPEKVPRTMSNLLPASASLLWE